MLKLLNIITKRPSDKTIKLGRIIFGVILAGGIYYNLIYLNKSLDNTFLDFSLFGFVLSNGFIANETEMTVFKYLLLILGLFPIFMGATSFCIAKKKYVRIMQIIFAFILFYIAGIMQDSPKLDFDSLLAIMGILPLFAGITGKCITSNCMKYKEKVTKIRV